ncbi:PAS domain S-box protein [Phormidium sp. LEGE 05292]|uniref:PAS domain S-box protein n=1 Tax=[Phormidium] sp. LEGE 05292 TaxID=767427 RepID=UPI00187EADF6|nr:PAS domain S-box protein [Phormidium sp. LEGE 05292]MBE9229789.1 PAS domain S-box protein [Phormidium sp. LEGE 05292]
MISGNPITEIVLEQAIIFNPLIVAPDVSLASAIACMSAARATCSLLEHSGIERNLLQTDSRASCLLVMEDSRLVGILTERDVVRLSAQGRSLKDRSLAEVMTPSVITLRKSEFSDIFVPLHILQRHQIRHLPLLDDRGQVIGLLTHESLRQLLRPVDLLRQRLVLETMTSEVIYASPETSVLQIARLMTKHRISSVVIVETQEATTESENGRLSQKPIPIGIVTEGDIVQFQALNLDVNQIQARGVMSTPLFAVRPSDSLWAAKSLMQEKRLSRVVVTGDRGELVGIVTQSTLLKTLNPLEMYKLVEVLEKKVSRLEAEKVELLEKRNTKLEEQVQQRTAELQKQTEREQLLSVIASRIRTSLAAQSTLDTVVKEVQQFLQCSRVLIYQFNSDWSGRVKAEAVLPGWQSALGDTIADSCFQQKAYQLYAQGEKQAISNIYEAGYSKCHIQLLERYQVKANLVVPILVEQQLWGLLIGHQCQSDRIWEPNDLELLDRIAVQIAIAIQQSQAYEKQEREITDRKQAEAAFQNLVEGAAGIGGENFFSELVRYIAEVLKVRYVMVATQKDNLLQSAALWLDGQVQPNVTYCMENTPCNLAVNQGEYLCLRGVQQQFPTNGALKTLNAESYLGVALTNTQGEIIGCLAVVDSKPLTQPQLAIAMLRVFAARVSAELERQAAIDALKRLNEELEERIARRTIELRQSEELFRQIFEQSPVGIAISDLEGNLTRVNSSLVQIAGYSKKDLLQISIQNILSINGQQQGVKLLDQLLEKTLSVITFESQIVSQKGEILWVNVTSSLIFNAFGRPSAMVHLIENVSDRKQAEAKLLKITSLQEAILNSADYSIISTDPTGIIQTFNLAAQRMLGYTVEEVVGKVTPGLIHDRAEVQKRAIALSEEMGRVIEPGFEVFIAKASQGISTEEEWTYIHKDGSRFPALLSVTALRDRQAEITGFVGIAKDITRQKQAEEKLHRILQELSDFKYALDEAAIVAIANAKGVITYANDRFCEISKYSREELIGNTHRSINSGYHSPEFFAQMWKIISSGETWRGEIQNRAKDGTYYWVDTTIVPFLNDQGKPIQYLSIRTDISTRKQAEFQQKQAEAKIRQANDQLLLTNAELARATRLKDEFLANMSHELRTPLNAVLGMTEGLQEGVFGSISDRQQQAIQTIERSGKHLLELINDILDLSKVESGKLELQIEPVSVNYLCQSSLTFVRQLAVKKNIELSSEVPPGLLDVAVDERRIRQVLINLLNNAVKFTPERGSVKLVVQTEIQPEQSFLILSVIDTGIGIDQADMNQLFQSFVQIDSSLNRQYAGTGLGLSLVRRLTELHGGTVTVTSEVGQGSCFTVRLPYLTTCELSSPKIQPINTVSFSPNNLRVLIIEDSLASVEQISRYVREVGMEAYVYSYGEGAIEEVLRIDPALIILDIQLPNLSGWTVLNQLKMRPRTKDIPVVVTSVMDERSRGLSLGALEYLVKPVTRNQLHSILKPLRSPQSVEAIHESPRQQQNESEKTTVAKAAQAAVTQQTKSSPLILLAEDNEASMVTISSYLKARGFLLLLAKDGEEAITLAKNDNPDLILMDIQMPKVDGLEAIRQIRADRRLVNIPIVALTALAMPSDQQKCIVAGANEYVPKPVKLKTLVEKIQTLLVATL